MQRITTAVPSRHAPGCTGKPVRVRPPYSGDFITVPCSCAGAIVKGDFSHPIYETIEASECEVWLRALLEDGAHAVPAQVERVDRPPRRIANVRWNLLAQCKRAIKRVLRLHSHGSSIGELDHESMPRGRR